MPAAAPSPDRWPPLPPPLRAQPRVGGRPEADRWQPALLAASRTTAWAGAWVDAAWRAAEPHVRRTLTSTGTALIATWRWSLPRGRLAGGWLWRAHRGRLDGLARLGALEVLVAFVVLTGTAVALVDLHVHAFRMLSPVDETMHLDAVFKAPRPISAGEHLGEEAMRATACRRIYSPFQPPPCDSPVLQPASFQANGFSTAYIHPPQYYRVAHWLADVIHGRWGTDDVDSARLGGAAWLAVGLLLLYLLSRRLGAGPAAAGGAALLIAAWPPVWYAHSVVTPDVTSLAVGAAVLYAAVAWGRSPAAVVVLPLAGWASVSFKLTNVLVVGVAGGYLLLSALLRRGNWQRRLTRVGIAAGAAALLAVPAALTAAAVSRATEARAILPLGVFGAGYYVDQLETSQVVAQWTHFLPPISIAHIAPFVRHTPENSQLWATLMALTGGLLTAAMLAAIFDGVRNRAALAVAVPTLLVSVLGGPLYALANFAATHGYFSVSVRYGYVLIPCWAALLAAVIRDRRLGYGLLGLGAAVCTYAIWLAAASAA